MFCWYNAYATASFVKTVAKATTEDQRVTNHNMGDALLLLRHRYADAMRVRGIPTRRK